MDKIYEYEDKIEEVKFLLSALKIQTAFTNLIRIADRKKINYYRTFTQQLQQYSMFQTIHSAESMIQRLQQSYEKIRLKLLRRVFYQIYHLPEKDVRKSDKRRESMSKQDHFQTKMMPISVINQQDWKQKLTPEELQMHCRYYRQKIQEVERSFADFFSVIKKQ